MLYHAEYVGSLCRTRGLRRLVEPWLRCSTRTGLALVVGAAACDSPTALEPVGSVEFLEAPARAEAGSSLTVRVRLVGVDGAPVAGAPARFIPSDGTVTPPQASTSSDGTVTTRWTVGTSLGAQTLRVDATGASSSASFDVGPADAAQLVVLSGDGQTGDLGQPLEEPLVVQARDAYGNPVPGVAVAFEVQKGDGSFADQSNLTGNDGTVAGRLTLGGTLGPQRVVARSVGIEPVSLLIEATAGPAAVLRAVEGDGQSAEVGTPLPVVLTLEGRDAFGNAIDDPVRFQVLDGSGTVSEEQAMPDEVGQLRVRWTLGTTAGTQRLEARAGSAVPLVFTADATPGPAVTLVKVSGDGQKGFLGTPLSTPLMVETRDRFGNPTGGQPVLFSVTLGNGSVTPGSTNTDLDGRLVATFTLGSQPGEHAASATLPGGTPVTFVASARTDPPAALSIVSGDNQTAEIGSAVTSAPVVLVRDAHGSPVPDVAVSFSIESGGGTLSESQALTDGQGFASSGRWTLGRDPGTNTLTASVPGAGTVRFVATATGTGSPVDGFQIVIEYVGSIGPEERGAILAAAGRWEAAITGDVSDFAVNLPAGACGIGHDAQEGIVDDVVVFVEFVSIDGVGGTLGSAGPCMIRASNRLPVFGIVKLDAADVANELANGTLDDVMLHELGHVLGIGSLWNGLGLVDGVGGTDPWFNGPQATAQYQAQGGSHPSGVPVENSGGTGTRDAHWRESLMSSEIMTGWINLGPNPLSTTTIGSLADLGYQVSYAAADGFIAGVPARAEGASPTRRIELIEVPLPPPMIGPGR